MIEEHSKPEEGKRGRGGEEIEEGERGEQRGWIRHHSTIKALILPSRLPVTAKVNPTSALAAKCPGKEKQPTEQEFISKISGAESTF